MALDLQFNGNLVDLSAANNSYGELVGNTAYLANSLLLNGGYAEIRAVGSGALDDGDPAPLLATYKYSVTFNMKNFLNLPGMGGFKIRPLIYSEAPVAGFMAPAVMPVEKVDVSCASGYTEEQYTLNFPKSVKILAVPKNMNLANDFLSYRSIYSQHHHTLVVTRLLDDKTPGNVCSPAMMAEYKNFDQQAVKDINAQVIYQTKD